MKYKFALLRSFIGSGNSTVSKLIMLVLPPYVVLFIRYLGGFLVTFFKSESRKYVREDLKYLYKNQIRGFVFIFSLVLTAVNVVLYYYILVKMPVTIFSVVGNGAYVIFLVILDRIILKEIKSYRTYSLMGLTVISLSIFVIMGSNEKATVGSVALFLMLLSSLGSAVESIITANNLKYLKSETIISTKMLVNALASLILMFVFGQSIFKLYEDMTLGIFVGLLFLIFSGVIVKSLEYKSIKVIGTSETAVFGILTFVFTAIISMIVFSEWLNVYQYLGLAGVVVSLYFIQKEDSVRKKEK